MTTDGPSRSDERPERPADRQDPGTRPSTGPGDPAGPGRGPGRRGYDPRLGCTRLLIWIILFVGIYALLGRLLGPAREGEDLAYTAFREEVEEGNVLTVEMRGPLVTGVLLEPVLRIEGGDTLQITEFVTHVPSVGDDELMSLLEANDVEVWTRPEPDSSWMQILVWGLVPMLVLGAVVFLFARGMAGRAQSLLSIGKSGAREYKREDSVVTFDDVAGASGAKRELGEIVSFLKDPAKFHRLGAQVPKGVLLVGPPGTGKTLLARAVAGEADVSFFIITGSDFMEMFVGVGAKRVRNLFENAKEAGPSIIFIDELDSIGRHRGAGLGGGHDEREQTLNQLLSALDGFEPTENVIVMAATNRPDILDPALLRPGRFDRRITVGLPTASERRDILRLHARTMRLAQDVDLDPIASGTPGFSGADLKNLLNEAALIAARRDGDRISAADLEQARDRILLGLKREGLALTDDEKRLLAYHEAGHALLAATLPAADPVHKVTIIPRGRSMGSTHQQPARDRFLWRRDELLDHLTMTLGGRAAEVLVFDTPTNGAEDDLHRATRLARKMVLRWGMSPAFGPFSVGSRDEQVFLGEQIARSPDHSEATAEAADSEVRRLLEEASSRALATLGEHRNALDAVAAALLEREEISGAEVMELLERERAVEEVSN